MRDELVDILACPTCRGDLLLKDESRASNGSVESGRLVCAGCGAAYPILRGIPRLIMSSTVTAADGRLETAAAFGFEWMHYPTENPYTRGQVVEWFQPLTPADFDGVVVLDGGCGTGGFAAYAADFGAKAVVAMDLGDAVEVAQRHTHDRPALHVVQADIMHPPFKPVFDLVYSVGVLHHLPNPREGFLALADRVQPTGRMFAWVYGYEGNGFVRNVIDPCRRLLTSRLPPRITKWGVALPLALVVWVVLAMGYRPPVPAWRKRVFRWYRPYLEWLAQSPFSFVHGVIFDQLVAPTTHYIREQELAEWCAAAGLSDVVIRPRNANSWRGLGTRRP